MLPATSHAERWDPNNSFDQGTVSAGIDYTGDERPSRSGSAVHKFHHEVEHRAVGLGGCTDTVREYVYRVWDDGSGRRELVYAGCPRVSTPRAPTPPSAAEVRDAVGIPDPTIGTNPQRKTLAGLRTDFWYTGPTERTVTVTLNGFTVTASARAVSYRWEFGDGAETTTTEPGTPERPAAAHAYQHRGTKTVTLTVTWSGTFTFTGPGNVAGGGDLGAEAFTSSRELPVEEIQPVGQPAS